MKETKKITKKAETRGSKEKKREENVILLIADPRNRLKTASGLI